MSTGHAVCGAAKWTFTIDRPAHMNTITNESDAQARGNRAEAVASWYLRVNGFMAIPGFIVHLDTSTPYQPRRGVSIHARTEADFVAVRFPYSKEIVGGKAMSDDPQVVKNTLAGGVEPHPLFVLAEVKASQCRMNGPWTRQDSKNMQRVLRRMGFTSEEGVIEAAATALYQSARWEGKSVIVQYVCFGEYASPELKTRHVNLVQITWAQIGAFLFERHKSHPEKTPGNFVHHQWPAFGKAFGKWFVRWRGDQGGQAAAKFVENYVQHGASGGA